MLVFGVEVPLVEVIFALALVTFVILVEVIIIISLLIKQTNKSKELIALTQQLSKTILQVKSAELTELDKLKRK